MTLELILDPEEDEYVLPNDGFTGFLVLLNASHRDHGSFFIGSGFHNMVRISSAGSPNGLLCSPNLRVESITQTTKSALYQSLLPYGIRSETKAEAEKEEVSRSIQQRAFLRAMNRTALQEIAKQVHELTKIKVALGFVCDLIRQGVQALKVETAMLPQTSCAKDLHRIGASLYVHLVDAQDKWDAWLHQSPDSLLINDSLTSADLELRLVGNFFSAQTIGARLRSHFRELIRSLLEVHPPRAASLVAVSYNSSSSRELFQPMPTARLMAAANETGCRLVQTVYRARTSILGERISSIVTLIDRMNTELHKLTAENRETRAKYALSQSTRHRLPLSKYVTASISVKENLHPTLCYSQQVQAVHRFDHLIGIVSGALSLWITLILLIELHRKNIHCQRRNHLQMRRLSIGVRDEAHAALENNEIPLPDERYRRCCTAGKAGVQPSLIRFEARGSYTGEFCAPTLETTELWPIVVSPPPPPPPDSTTEPTLTAQTRPPTLRAHQERSRRGRGNGPSALLEPSSSTQTVILDGFQNRF
uniref:Uncharacterized protein n=1 Tax=Mesocestoides corti TaxID=53468 RepID=A0A5K3EW51_MESCO